MLFVIDGRAEAYYVSGVADFTYQSYSSKVGEIKTSSSAWTAHAYAKVESFIYDPRFLRLTAGVGYSMTDSDTSPASDTLSYNINAVFFPGRTISWTVYGARDFTKVNSASIGPGYDMESTSYGGTLMLRLSPIRTGFGNFNNNRNRNNNNNNNNDNNNNNNNNNNGNGNRNNRWGFSIPLPDIQVTTNHSEAQTTNSSFPLNESRDNTTEHITYRINSTLDMTVDGAQETFKDIARNTSYRTETYNLHSMIHVSKTGDMKITGRLDDRTFQNMAGFASYSAQTNNLGAELLFKEVNRFSHSYSYYYQSYDQGQTKLVSNDGSANLRYTLLPELALNAGAAYHQVDYNYGAVPTAPAAPTTIKDMQLYSGISYLKNYRPELLDPFTLKTGYDLTLGRANVSTATQQAGQSGLYYQNAVNLGLHSSGWKQDDVYLDYSYLNRRDHSPLKNDNWSHSYHLGVSTARVPRTTITANAYYISQHSSSGFVPSSFINYMIPGTQLQNRTLNYAATLDHNLTSYLTFNMGASKGNSSASTIFTLSTTQVPGTQVDETVYSAGMNLNYAVTRQLTVRATIREELRNAKERNGNTIDTTVRQATAGFDYRFRKITINSDYLLREDISKTQPRTVQQSFIIRATRPF